MLRCSLLILLLAATAAVAQEKQHPDPTRWQSAINRFQKIDAENENTISENPILFVGSSSILFWNVKTYFPDCLTINRGFGGSLINDVLHYFPDVISKYKPKTIVFYSGDNDFADGLSVDQVLNDYKTLIERIRKELPEAQLIVLGIKPSPARWHLWDKMQQVNAAVKKIAEADAAKKITYIDTATPLLDPNTHEPDLANYKSDKLHLNDIGYSKWTKLVVPLLGCSRP